MPPSVAAWLRRRGRRRVRRQMRGYHRLRAGGRLDFLSRVRNELTETPLESCRGKCAGLFFGPARAHAEIVVRQYLLLRVVGADKLYRSLLRSIGDSGVPVAHPLPAEWRQVLRRNGFAVPRLRSAAMWHGYVFLLFGYGVLGIATQMFRFFQSRGGRAAWHGAYVFFAGLSPSNVPQPSFDGRSYDIISWYQQWPGRIRELSVICHTAAAPELPSRSGAPVRRVDAAVPPPATASALVRFCGWSVAAVAGAAFDFARGRWWHALLLNEAASAALVRLHRPEALAREYLFHNSDSLYRPLWTYAAEAKGSAITFYFYSTNNETFKRRAGYGIQAGSWQVMRWPRYLVWDDAQADFVRRAVGDAPRIEVVGPIWFGCSAEAPPRLPPNCIAVFDVQPVRSSRYQALGLAHEFYAQRSAIRLVRDVHLAAGERGRSIAFKRKREIGSLVHKGYAAAVESLGSSPHFMPVPPGVSAQRVIEQAAAVISMPFTSTALIARALGKPSIYYDPLGLLEKDDRAARGIPVLQGLAELRAWLGELESGAVGGVAPPRETAQA